MMLRKFVFGLGVLALASCGSIGGNMAGNNNDDQLTWFTYIDIDKSPQTISFMREVSVSDDGAIIIHNTPGIVLRKTGAGNEREKLGNLHNLDNGNGETMLTIFLQDQKQSLNPNNKDHMQQLAQSKQFDFYEFGKGRATHAQFSAQDNICQSFKSRRGVNVKMATTYYAENNYANFYTSFTSGNIRPKQVKITNYEHSFSNQEAQQQFQETAEKNGRNLAQRSLRGQANILANVVCQ
ncbi:hypothetical protein [Neisseria montereyensis]|uniref:DUF8095 domain-containing protein n=1 Tax=Neisseria montereyensis TaxID=2973938 RepID=A0ABT2FCF9_9NEIS|nr:hypothetical protein [Neisseria montereyensis]MCS4533904.1 hypothetical protein [Neisseria montereyensis]